MNQSGVVTLSFMVSLVVAFGMSAILFAIAMTLVVVETTQYVTFSTARALIGANVSVETQIENAKNKYKSLVGSPILAPLYSNGWFEVSGIDAVEIKTGNGSYNSNGSSNGSGSFSADYPSVSEQNREIWTGVRTKFVAKILSMNLPMVGNTTPEDSEGLRARIFTPLIREVSQDECQKFIQARYQKILSLDTRYKRHDSGNISDYVPLEDNGC